MRRPRSGAIRSSRSNLSLLKHVAWILLFASASLLPTISQADNVSAIGTDLVQLAETRFSTLTPAETRLLTFSRANRGELGEFAVAGPSPDPDSPANNPKNGEAWGPERNLRASFIRWLCTDPEAIGLEDKGGIRILGARIVGSLDLSNIRVPFALVMRNCLIGQRLRLAGTEISQLDLGGSYIGEFDGAGLDVEHDLNLGDGLRASGETVLENASIGGNLHMLDGHFTHSAVEMVFWAEDLNMAVDAKGIKVVGDILLNYGFAADGEVMFDGSSGTNLFCQGGRFLNPHKKALSANLTIFTSVNLGSDDADPARGFFEADGTVEFSHATVRTVFAVLHAFFKGAAGDSHGFYANDMHAATLIWLDVRLENGAVVDLMAAKVDYLVDEERSWPEPGNLKIEGFTYGAFGVDSPWEVQSRLAWINLGKGASPQAYRQLAKVYHDAGFEERSIEVLVAQSDARYAKYGVSGPVVGWFLRSTVGHGHRPLLALFWSLAIVLLGWIVVLIGVRAGVMRPTWPENRPATEPQQTVVYERLNPLLYSLDTFLPFVNLHQEHYWWPDAAASGKCLVMGRAFGVRGSVLRYYLWLQIIAGWILSAIFVAGVTGLLKND